MPGCEQRRLAGSDARVDWHCNASRSRGMERFKKILAVVDEGPENRVVVERAVGLARRNEARLTVVNTMRPVPPQAPGPPTLELPALHHELAVGITEEWPPGEGLLASREALPTAKRPGRERTPGAEMPDGGKAVRIREHVIEHKGQLLEQWVGFAERHGVLATGKTLCGTPFVEIIREVLRNDYDLVMASAENGRALKGRFLGSTALHLMRKCPCPVWVVRSSQPERGTPILAAVDPSFLDGEEYAVSVKIMDLATELARREERELVVVHTWRFPAEQPLRRGFLLAPSELDGWVERTRLLHRRRLADLLQPYGLKDLNSRVFMLKGEPARVIPELAAALGVRLIVMSTVCRTGVAGLFMGSTAERILRQVDCAVLAVKPDGFVTPVRLDG